eukprot:CAMPEP_0179954186 /NCGR_PEP_ID=MMETSP0983-20121128/25347_1 /TAXON_ID=483367 /ORGANISM="non described non described, Strain CCMP 2436" /LENGTH=67 /DNA_ID=CAMNT_0021865201 /DNA_START=69 /DNA_END=272 /DNA_ORIENTATION=+
MPVWWFAVQGQRDLFGAEGPSRRHARDEQASPVAVSTHALGAIRVVVALAGGGAEVEAVAVPVRSVG